MSDLDHWSEDGATAAEIAAMDRLRDERPHSSLHARTLGVALGAGTGLVASTAAGAGGIGLITKLVGLGVLVVGGAAIGIAVHSSRGSAPEGPGASAAPILAMEAASADPVPAIAASASDEAVIPPPEDLAPASSASGAAAVRVAPKPRASASAPSLNAEIASIEKAHAANDPDATLRALDDYRARFPKGTMSAEATVLRVQALLARGDVAKARALADSFFSSAHPESPYARRVQDLVRSAAKK